MLIKNNSTNFANLKNKNPIKILCYNSKGNIYKNNGNLNLSHSYRLMKLKKNHSFFNNNSKSFTNISQSNNQSNILDEESKLKSLYYKLSYYKNNYDNTFDKVNSFLKNDVSKSQKNFSMSIPIIKSDNSLLIIRDKIKKIESKKFVFNQTKVLNKLYKNELFCKFQKEKKKNNEKSRYLRDINNKKNNIKKLKNFIEILNSIIKKIKEINLKYFIFKTQVKGEKKEENKTLKKNKSMSKIKSKIHKDFNIFKKDLDIKKKKTHFKLQQEIYLYNLKKKLNLFDNLNYSTIYKNRDYIAKKIQLGWDQAYAYKKNGRNIIRNSLKYIKENKELEKKKIKIIKPDSFLI